MRVRKTSKSTILVTGECLYKLEMKLLKEIGDYSINFSTDPTNENGKESSDFTAGYLNLGEMVKAIHK